MALDVAFTTASPATQCIPTREDQVALRKGCDLVNVGGNIIDTSPTHSLNPMTTLTQVQDDQAFGEELTDQELESINGGWFFVLPLIPEDKMEAIKLAFRI